MPETTDLLNVRHDASTWCSAGRREEWRTTAVATAPSPSAPSPSPYHGLLHSIGRMLVVPAAVGALVIVVTGALGHVVVGLMIGVGLVLGAVNGVSAQISVSRLNPQASITRGMIVQSSLRRLFVITAVALLIAWLAQPTGWTVLLGLALYQLLSLGSALGTAMREVRGG